MSVYEKKIPQWKIDLVDKLAETIKNSKMVGLVNVEGVGAKQLQGIRDSLRGSAKIKMARNTLMKRAIDESEQEGIEDLAAHLKGPVSFIFSDEDPFLLSKFLSENKAAAPAKGGQVSPKDIIVPAMNTGVAPGPFISELAALDIPSRVKGGVIHVTEDTVAVEAGEVISNAMAQMLGRLGIEPMELQLKLVAAYADGTVLTTEDLEIDLEALFGNVLLGHQYAVNLSVNTGYPTSETIPLIIAKANMEAKNLALTIGFFTPELLNEFLAKANSEAAMLAGLIADKDPDAIPSDLVNQIQAAAAAPPEAPSAEESPDEEEEAEEEEDEEEEAVAGLGGLFG
ncbi:50S ribosomal protein L10 [Candidatus Thorarchaeota archaeon]|nr:MAG: 50S ribosomal protein L10 [Candidatus Thorarchaeota archaeon]